MKTPRRSSRPEEPGPGSRAEKWWETDELVTLVDALAISGLDEASIEALVSAGKIASIVHGGIRFFRQHDLMLYAIPK